MDQRPINAALSTIYIIFISLARCHCLCQFVPAFKSFIIGGTTGKQNPSELKEFVIVVALTSAMTSPPIQVMFVPEVVEQIWFMLLPFDALGFRNNLLNKEVWLISDLVRRGNSYFWNSFSQTLPVCKLHVPLCLLCAHYGTYANTLLCQ